MQEKVLSTTAVKRRLSPSHSSGEAERVRTRLRPDSPLTLKTSGSNDDDSTDAVNASPIHDDADDDENDMCSCYQKCEAMTGTREGLDMLLSDSGYKHLNWYEILETSGGCTLCRTIFDITEHTDWDRDSEGSFTREEIRVLANITRLPSFSNEVSLRHPLEGIQLHGLEVVIPLDRRLATTGSGGEIFNFVTYEADAASKFIPGRRESKRLSSRVAREINRWLDNCFDKHSSCPRRRMPELPRIVLDIRTDGSPIRLHQSQDGEKAQYVALSYCWGRGVQTLATTTKNVQNYVHKIPDSLPQTFSDAVEVCRKIGIRYLWVDALCIIQDNNEDKLDQISKMGAIYENSTVTVVAACAEKATDGFLLSKKRRGHLAHLPLYIDNSTTGKTYLGVKGVDLTNPFEEPIFQRAWTFQELLLSPRALIFDSYQIIRKCLQSGFRSVPETYLEFDYNLPDLPVSVFGLVDENMAGRNTEESREYYRKVRQDYIWTRFVSAYSARDLTLFSDRLPALAGVAAELAASWNDTYIAGFWCKTIVQHLGWYRCGTPIASVDGARRIGSPSWSWATMPCPVRVGQIMALDAKLVSYEVKPRYQTSPFGEVGEATIALEARVLNMSSLALKFKRWPYSSVWESNNVWLDFEHPVPDLGRCRLVYLGQGNYRSYARFLAIEKSTKGDYHCVGYAELSEWVKRW